MGVGKGIEITAGMLKEITSAVLKIGTSVVKKGSEVGEIGIINA